MRKPSSWWVWQFAACLAFCAWWLTRLPDRRTVQPEPTAEALLADTTEQPFDVRWVDQDGNVVAELTDVTEITAPGFRGFSMWPPRSNGVAIIRVKRAAAGLERGAR